MKNKYFEKLRERYMSPEKGQNIIDDLRFI